MMMLSPLAIVAGNRCLEHSRKKAYPLSQIKGGNATGGLCAQLLKMIT